MNKFLDILIPRFITEKVAVIVLENGDYQPICCVDDLTPMDNYDKLITVRTFNFFGFGLFPKTMSTNINNPNTAMYVVWIDCNLGMDEDQDWEQNSEPQELKTAVKEVIECTLGENRFPATALPLGITPRLDGLFSNPDTDPDLYQGNQQKEVAK